MRGTLFNIKTKIRVNRQEDTMKSRLRRKRQRICTLSTAFLMTVVCSSSICMVNGADPISLHHLVEVQPGTNAVISLQGYDLDGDKVSGWAEVFPSTSA